MSNASNHYHQLLVAVDLGDMTEPVVRRATDLAGRLGTPLDVAHVLDKVPLYLRYTLPHEELMATEAKGSRWSQEGLQDLKRRYPQVRSTYTTRGAFAQEVCALAKQLETGMLVLGVHMRRGMAVLFGDRSDEILHKAPCDLLLVKPEGGEGAAVPRPYQRVLAAVDLGPQAALVVNRAADLARRHGAELRLINVIDHFPQDRSNVVISPEDQDPLVFAQEQAERRLRELAVAARAADSRIEVVVSPSRASRAIAEAATGNGSDLVVAGSHGHQGLGRILGSTADGICHLSPCDVLVVRTPVAA
jgi:universal stress protein A